MDKNQYFIHINRAQVKVTEEVHRVYHKMGRRERYLGERDATQGKILYSDLDTQEVTGEEMIPDLNAVNIEDSVVQSLMKKALHDALETLSGDEQTLIEMLYFANCGAGITQRDAAAVLGISQPAVKKRHDKIINKMRVLIVS